MKENSNSTPFSPRSILLIGIRGDLAQTTAKLIHKKYPEARILGIDGRPFEKEKLGNIHENANITTIHLRYNRSNFESLFRNNSFDLVYHIGRIIHPEDDEISNHFSKKIDLTLMETRRVLDLCLEYAVKRVVFLSTYHVYGAHPDNPGFLDEEAPLRASLTYPQLMKAVEVDQICAHWMWKNQGKIETILLRPCSIIGPQITNTIAKYLTTWYSPRPVDYNPMFQFIHEFDMAKVLVHSSDHFTTGVYNVAYPEYITLRTALETVRIKGIPTSLAALGPLVFLLKKIMPQLPDYLVDYLKYSCLLETKKLQQELPENFFRYKAKEALALMSTL